MLAAVMGFSFIPVVIGVGTGAENPFLFNMGWRLGVLAGCLSFLGFRYRPLLFDRRIAALSWRRIFTRPMLLVIFGSFQFAIFTWSTRFIDISLAAVLLETWPIILIVLTARLFRTDNRFRRTSRTVYLLVIIGFIGFVFAMASQSTGFTPTMNLENTAIITIVVGTVLAIAAAGAGAVEAAFNFRWGSDLSRELLGTGRIEQEERQIDLFFVVVAFAIGSAVSAPMHAAAGLLTGESITVSVFITAIVVGGFVQAISSIFYRVAILRTDNLGINALGYTIPVFSLLWLAIFSLVNVARFDYLVIGAAAIITANLLINFEADIRFGFKALILALWACGAFVYLRDEFLIYLPFGDWLWPRETYLGALGFSATVFILLLTFRVARIAPRTQDEDNRIFALHRNLELLARRGLIAPEASEHVRAIDGARNVEELQLAYTRVKLCFVQAAAMDLPLADRRLLANAETQLNMMVHSRQQGVDFGELFALIIFGGSTVLLSLLSRPAVEGWTAFIYEVFSALFPAVIIFLIVNVWDLHRDRADLVLATEAGPEGYGVIFRDPRSRRFEQGVSIVIGLLIIVAYAVLLWYKWIG